METFIEDIEEFHDKFNHTYQDYPRPLTRNEKAFRITCLREEIREYEESENLEEELDALVDLVYFALGTAYRHGFDFKEAWKRVHTANMRKIRAGTASESKRGSNLDIIKPKNWKKPYLIDLVRPQPNPALVSISGGVYAKKRHNITSADEREIVLKSLGKKASKRLNLPPAEGRERKG